MTAHALALVLGGVEHGGAGVQRTGIDAEEAQTAHIGVGHDLEGQRGEGLVVRGLAVLLLIGLGVDTLDSGDVGGGGHIVDNSVEQLLHALVAVGRTADDGDHLHGDSGPADGRTDLVGGDLLALEVHLHDLVIEHGHRVEQLLAVLVGQIHHILGDRLHAHVLAQLIVVDIGIHLHQIDDTLEGILLTDGELDGHSVALQAVLNHVQHVIKIRAGDVHLVDVNHTGDMIMVSLTPHRLGLGLHAALGAHHRDGAVQNTQRTLHFDGEVHVTGGVDDVDARLGELVLLPFQ